MPDGSKIVRYDEFSGGEFGAIDPGKAPAHTFHAKNMLVYRNGQIGPRAGAKALAYTSVGNGVVVGMGWRGTPNVDLWWVVGTAVKYANSRSVGSAAGTFTGALASTPTAVEWVAVGNDDTYLVSYGDKVYHLSHLGPTNAAVSGSPGGADITVHGQRLFVAGGPSDLDKVFYSDLADFDTWGASSYFFVGNASGAVRGVWSQRNHLTILTQNGEWWVLTGEVGGTPTLRRVTGGGVDPWAAGPNTAEINGADLLVHVPINSDFPAEFDGSSIQEHRHLEVNSGTPFTGATDLKVVRGMRPDEALIVFPTTKKFAIDRNGVWTFHTSELSAISPFVVSDGQGQIIFCKNGTVSTAAEFFTMKLDLDRPGFVGDGLSQPGDASTTPLDCTLDFPIEWSPPGKERRVRSVTVDYTKWDTGNTGNANKFRCTPKTWRHYSLSGPQSATAQTWTEAAASASTSGIKARKVFRFGTESKFGGGFQITFDQIIGVSFDSFVVEYEERDIPRT